MIRIDDCESFGSLAENTVDQLVEYGMPHDAAICLDDHFKLAPERAIILHHDETGKWLVNLVEDLSDENSTATTYEVTPTGDVQEIEVDREWG